MNQMGPTKSVNQQFTWTADKCHFFHYSRFTIVYKTYLYANPIHALVSNW